MTSTEQTIPSLVNENAVGVEQLTSWQDEYESGEDSKDADQLEPDTFDPLSAAVHEKKHNESKFPVNETFNQKLFRWSGNLVNMQTDAIVNPSNESLTDRSGVCGDIFSVAGDELEDECEELEGCRTGEAKITKGYNLPASHVIHTVGPRFNLKYETAAENALHNCYRNSLQLLLENKLSSICFPVVHSERRGFPPIHGAHVTLRTVRRFLEHWGEKLETIVLCIPKGTMWDVYESIIPLYFPRSSQEEEEALDKLPKDVGNEFGETVIEERNIRIGAMPGMGSSEEDEAFAAIGGEGGSSDNGSSSSTSRDGEVQSFFANESIVGSSATFQFANMSDDYDREKLNKMSHKSTAELEEEETQREVNKYLRISRQQDMSEMKKLGYIYASGKDPVGRRILVVVGANLPAKHVDMEIALAYAISVMDPVVQKDYVCVYCHSDTTDDNLPDFSLLYKIYDIFTYQYKNNLKALYIVHPTFWVKTFFWFMTPFLSSNFSDRVTNIERITDLYTYIEYEQVEVPDFVFQWDHDKFGPPKQEVRRGNIGTSDL